MLSAAILAITLFHLSFKPTGTLLGFAEVGNVTPLKVWLTLSAVLAYMFLRYWFHDDTDRDLSALNEHFQSLRYAAIRQWLSRDARAYLLMRRDRPRLVDGFAMRESERFAEACKQFGRPIFVDIESSISQDADQPWMGTVKFIGDVNWQGGFQQSTGGHMPFKYRFSRRAVLYIAVATALRTATYSKSAVDLLVPLGLSFVAACMCISQLVRAILA
ncbi:hypothetical protein AB4Y42_02450 [Paraburkholderia sp. EG286B]|uniref:hypothetical protein n=1 Tax=Paraburkholderia sp. EG286B TaxID=3237011 RepID=UPI0034D2BEEA